jgi:microcystin-dependent protein
MSEPFIAEIKMFGGNFAPNGYAFCNGQLLSIAQNTALFSLVGTIYGGNGQVTFGLPNLQGRFPMHWGSGAGLSPRNIGELGGTETNTLSLSQLPVHSHAFNPGAHGGEGQTALPSGNYPAAGEEPTKPYGPSADTALGASNTAAAGSSFPVNNMPPYQCVSFIIALVGIYPSRS